jgi:Probable cobalt transporter subunit (CbtA)
LSARHFLVRGLLAGLIGGLAAFGVALVAGEPALNAAIAIEQSTGHEGDTHAEPAGDTVVPRWLQASAGLLTGTIVAGVTLGGLVGVLTGLATGRLGNLGARGTALSVTAIGFVAIAVVPFVAYPPNPPSVGHPETIGQRTALYFVLMAISVITAAVAILLGRRAAKRWGGWYSSLAAIAGYLVAMTVIIALMPCYDEVPPDFPASLLYQFRLAGFGTQLALWAVLGVALAELISRQLRRRRPAVNPLAETAADR